MKFNLDDRKIKFMETKYVKKIEMKRGRTTNGEIDPVADQIYKIWNCTNFVI